MTTTTVGIGVMRVKSCVLVEMTNGVVQQRNLLDHPENAFQETLFVIQRESGIAPGVQMKLTVLKLMTGVTFKKLRNYERQIKKFYERFKLKVSIIAWHSKETQFLFSIKIM